jgi:hypothetical protein
MSYSAYVYEDIRNPPYRLKIIQDTDAGSPRSEYDNLGSLCLWVRDISPADKNPYRDRWEFEDKFNINNAFILPVEYYSYSNALRWIEPPKNYNWVELLGHHDGYIYVTKDDIRKEWGVKRISQKLADQVMKNLKSEIEVYSQYLEGDCWGFEITRIPDDKIVDDFLNAEELPDEPVDP